MKISAICLCTLLLICYSCKQRHYVARAANMEETIRVGDRFAVTLTDKFERNDIVTFDYFGPDYNSPDEENGGYKSHWESRVDRLIAYSGDSVEINGGEVFVNGRRVKRPSTGKLMYDVMAKGYIDEFGQGDEYNSAPPVRKSGDTIIYTVSFSPERALEYEGKKPFIIGVKRVLEPNVNYNDTMYARASQNGRWGFDYYGPFRIPIPGETVFVDDDNFKFYGNIPGIRKGLDTIKEKLYFVLGDNFYAAADSRFIGLIAQSKVYGVVK